MRIPLEQARAFWADPSQHVMGITPETLPDEFFEYWANGPVCLVLHQAPWPDVWMAHFGVKPEGRGAYVEPTKAILAAFWQHKQPSRIVGWIDSKNRLALAFAKRRGFTVDGEFPTKQGTVVMTGWCLSCQ